MMCMIFKVQSANHYTIEPYDYGMEIFIYHCNYKIIDTVGNMYYFVIKV
jgi:hypothetical protein